MIATFITEREILWLFLTAGVLVWMYKSPPTLGKSLHSLLLFPILLHTGDIWMNKKLTQIGWFFFKAGAFVFGSRLAIVPFLYGGVAHWS